MRRSVASLSLALLLGACASAQEPPSAAVYSPPPVTAAPTSYQPGSIGARMAASWHHEPRAASPEQFERDKSRCHAAGMMAPPDAGSLWLKQFLIFENCMKGAGYIQDR